MQRRPFLRILGGAAVLAATPALPAQLAHGLRLLLGDKQLHVAGRTELVLPLDGTQ